MEYLILAVSLGLCVILVFGKKVIDQKKRECWLADRFRTEFGCAVPKTGEPERMRAISGYFRHHQDSFFIDDITCNDLELERIFVQMDNTKSSAGQEYLYYMLRTPSFSEKELTDREEKLRFWTTQEELRVQLQMIFYKLGKTGKYSIYDYLEFLDTLGERSNRKHFGGWLLFAAAFLSLYLNPTLGIILLCAAAAYNISAYLREKKEIEPYLVSFKYVFRAMEASKRILALPGLGESIQYQKETAQLKKLLNQFSGLKVSGRFGMHVMGDGGNPLELVADYVNMLFHLDLIGFNVMLGQLRLHRQQIDEMLGVLGRMEALIAVASYRMSLPVWCVPVLCKKEADQAEAMSLSAKELYHPLIADAVRNDIHTRRGVLVTGSNASGKSTFLKAVAINAIFAQTIHTCVASMWKSGYFRVFSSMALRDDLESKESYYIVEIKALKRILDSTDKEDAPVLCFVDEVLRGTNTVERIAASTQILKSLGGNALCFAATHDIELTELLEKEYDNYHFQEQVEDGDIFFPYKLMEGRAQSRNAIRLLSLMGYGDEIILRAEQLASYFIENGSWQNGSDI